MWISLGLTTDAAHTEALSEALLEAGALSVSVEDADAGTEREVPQFGEPGSPAEPLWQASRVLGLFPEGTDVTRIVAQCALRAGLAEVPAYGVERIADQDWVRLTQAQFEPIRVNERLWIVPSWHDAPDPRAINIVLDPGMAFGTGSHPTTRLCLDWLCDHAHTGLSVLDYGCGSGILAIAAARLGAAPVVAADIDEQALVAARDNAARNAVALDIRHAGAPMDEQFDRVVANILTNPLCVLAPLLAARLRPGGWLALSGILEAQAALVREAYRPYLDLEAGAVLDGWVRLQGRRP